MKNIIYTDNISLDYFEDLEINGESPYRITLYDKHGHFDNEFYMSAEQINDLTEGLNK